MHTWCEEGVYAREQEEREEAEEYRFGGIVIFHITSNADEELRGRGIQARKISSSITRVLARWRGERCIKYEQEERRVFRPQMTLILNRQV